MKSRSRILTIALLCSMLSTLLFAAPQRQKASAERGSIAQGKIFVQTACTACHSTMVIENAYKNREGWLKTIAKMEKQGMLKIPKNIQVSIIEFLSEAQGEKSSKTRENRGPWGDRRNANPLW